MVLIQQQSHFSRIQTLSDCTRLVCQTHSDEWKIHPAVEKQVVFYHSSDWIHGSLKEGRPFNSHYREREKVGETKSNRKPVDKSCQALYAWFLSMACAMQSWPVATCSRFQTSCFGLYSRKPNTCDGARGTETLNVWNVPRPLMQYPHPLSSPIISSELWPQYMLSLL